ncbi:MAG: DUF2240 family protein [Euryarchaeota archaeon]|nr:DUF2240 family protein [Euryarchaeota archaeon]
MGELETAIAAIFKAKGSEKLGEREFVMFASMNKRWFSPKDAQRMMEAGVKAKLLALSDGTLTPTFKVADVSVPIDFAPSQKLFQEGGAAPLFQRLVAEISRAKRMNKREAIAAVNRKQEEADVEIEVAALLVAREAGIDIGQYIGEAKEEILGRYRQE